MFGSKHLKAAIEIYNYLLTHSKSETLVHIRRNYPEIEGKVSD